MTNTNPTVNSTSAMAEDVAISHLNTDGNNDDASYHSLDSAAYDPTSTRFLSSFRFSMPKSPTTLMNKPLKTL
jgi:hypothetical protein